MNCDYDDIRSRISEDPQWWDENAVPRYGMFAPKLIANIYAAECVFMVIACQGCGREFRVAMSRTGLDPQWVGDSFPPHYGDPPNIDCCSAGPTMNVELVRVLEEWRHDDLDGWKRVQSAEVR